MYRLVFVGNWGCGAFRGDIPLKSLLQACFNLQSSVSNCRQLVCLRLCAEESCFVSGRAVWVLMKLVENPTLIFQVGSHFEVGRHRVRIATGGWLDDVSFLITT